MLSSVAAYLPSTLLRVRKGPNIFAKKVWDFQRGSGVRWGWGMLVRGRKNERERMNEIIIET